MILNIRGTHGSGKSWLVHQLLSEGSEPIADDYGNCLGYELPWCNGSVVGRYTNVCGGCDGIKTADEVVARVKRFNQEYEHVVFEGILVSHTFKRYSDLAKELDDYWFLFLDTPLEVCIARVEARRKARGCTKPLDPKNIIKDYHNVWERVQQKCRNSKYLVKVLNWQDPLLEVLEMLQS